MCVFSILNDTHVSIDSGKYSSEYTGKYSSEYTCFLIEPLQKKKKVNLPFNSGVFLLLCFTVLFPGSASPINQALLTLPPTVLSAAALSCFSSVLFVTCVCVCESVCVSLSLPLSYFLVNSRLNTKILDYCKFELFLAIMGYLKEMLLLKYFCSEIKNRQSTYKINTY